jgi:hypothetical protein
MMKKSTRVLIAGLVVEALLAGIGIWLLTQLASGSLTPTTSIAETRATIFTVLGGAMGALGGVLIVAWIVAKRREA